MNMQVRRIVDANLNRVSEGLRVAEDVCRYAWNDWRLQEGIKAIRHEVAVTVDQRDFIPARNPASDVGGAPGETFSAPRRDMVDVMKANLKRAQEGLRVLEEVFKIGSPKISDTYRKLRFRTYEIERKVFTRRKRTLEKGLYLILTERSPGIEELAAAAATSDLSAVQLRCRNVSDRVFLDLARRIREITLGTSTRFIINDRPDIALLACADGVHLGQEDIDPAIARDFLGPEAIIGLSTHHRDQVVRAHALPVDYIGFGPVFATGAKERPDPVTGTAALKDAVSLSMVPVVAIGGITREAVYELRQTGCHCIAVISAVAAADDPGREMACLHTMFLEAS